jgi:hypothetical protein
MTYSAPARQRKPTLWDSEIAVCRRLGLLLCDGTVGGRATGRGERDFTLTETGYEASERLLAARQAGLTELLGGWDPEAHPEIDPTVRQLAHVLQADDTSYWPMSPSRLRAQQRSGDVGPTFLVSKQRGLGRQHRPRTRTVGPSRGGRSIRSQDRVQSMRFYIPLPIRCSAIFMIEGSERSRYARYEWQSQSV